MNSIKHPFLIIWFNLPHTCKCKYLCSLCSCLFIDQSLLLHLGNMCVCAPLTWENCCIKLLHYYCLRSALLAGCLAGCFSFQYTSRLVQRVRWKLHASPASRRTVPHIIIIIVITMIILLFYSTTKNVMHHLNANMCKEIECYMSLTTIARIVVASSSSYHQQNSFMHLIEASWMIHFCIGSLFARGVWCTTLLCIFLKTSCNKIIKKKLWRTCHSLYDNEQQITNW